MRRRSSAVDPLCTVVTTTIAVGPTVAASISGGKCDIRGNCDISGMQGESRRVLVTEVTTVRSQRGNGTVSDSETSREVSSTVEPVNCSSFRVSAPSGGPATETRTPLPLESCAPSDLYRA
jgi:hypothetical protein